MTMTHKIVGAVSALAFAILIATVVSDHLQTPTDFHQIDIELEGGVPATLYFEDSDYWPDKGPSIVLAHGYATDRKIMAGLAESLVHAGYIVVSIDASGHGMNRNAFSVRALFDHAALTSGIKAGVGFLRRAIHLEPSQIVVVGHSLGARAVAAYGSHESDVGGLVMLSSTWEHLGSEHLENALFVFAERDDPIVGRSSITLATRLANGTKVEPGKTYGDFSLGTAVRVVEIPGTGHGTLVLAPATFSEIVNWADSVTGQPARSEPARFVENPLGPKILWFSFLLVLPGLGLFLAQFSPVPAQVERRVRWFDLALLALALLLPLVFVAEGWPGVLMGLSDADINVTHLALGGVLLTAILVLVGRLRHVPSQLSGSIAVALAGWVAVSTLLAPVSAYFHGVGLTPEKAGLFLWTAICLLPFAFAFQLLLYRDRWWHGTLLRLGGRILVLIAVAVGMVFGAFTLSGVITIFVLLVALLIVEPILAGLYARSNNLVTGASLDAIVTAWLFALFLASNY